MLQVPFTRNVNFFFIYNHRDPREKGCLQTNSRKINTKMVYIRSIQKFDDYSGEHIGQVRLTYIAYTRECVSCREVQRRGWLRDARHREITSRVSHPRRGGWAVERTLSTPRPRNRRPGGYLSCLLVYEIQHCYLAPHRTGEFSVPCGR